MCVCACVRAIAFLLAAAAAAHTCALAPKGMCLQAATVSSPHPYLHSSAWAEAASGCSARQMPPEAALSAAESAALHHLHHLHHLHPSADAPRVSGPSWGCDNRCGRRVRLIPSSRAANHRLLRLLRVVEVASRARLAAPSADDRRQEETRRLLRLLRVERRAEPAGRLAAAAAAAPVGRPGVAAGRALPRWAPAADAAALLERVAVWERSEE